MQASIERLTRFIREDRIIRGEWGETDKDGREVACLLGSLGGDIQSSSDCPSTIMPLWMAHLTVRFNDDGSLDKWPGMIRRYGSVAQNWSNLDDSAWLRVKAKTILAALEIARHHDRNDVVEPVMVLWRRAYNGDVPGETGEPSVMLSYPCCRYCIDEF